MGGIASTMGVRKRVIWRPIMLYPYPRADLTLLKMASLYAMNTTRSITYGSIIEAGPNQKPTGFSPRKKRENERPPIDSCPRNALWRPLGPEVLGGPTRATNIRLPLPVRPALRSWNLKMFQSRIFTLTAFPQSSYYVR